MAKQQTELELINTNLKRYTFESPRIKKWVEDNSNGKCLNLFAGKTNLNLDEIRNDVDKTMLADYHKDAVNFVKEWKGKKFNTIILDPPYAYRKSMEMYNGNKASRFRILADEIPRILAKDGVVISFGYHSTFLSKKRNATLKKLCVFAHGGSQHCTIGIIEQLNNGNDGIPPKHKCSGILPTILLKKRCYNCHVKFKEEQNGLK